MADQKLYGSNDLNRWHAACRLYTPTISALAVKKPELPALDHWVLCELPQVICKRGIPKITQPELSRLMRWKLMKGKFRPNLQKYADALTPAEVEDASLKAFSFVSAQNLPKAIEALCTLKGIGPATASAVLSVYDPTIPFMSDEALEHVVGTRNYTVGEFKLLTQSLREQASILNHEKHKAHGSGSGSSSSSSSSGSGSGSGSGSSSSNYNKMKKQDRGAIATAAGANEKKQQRTKDETVLDDEENDITVFAKEQKSSDAPVDQEIPPWTANRCQLAIWAHVNSIKLGIASPPAGGGSTSFCGCGGSTNESSSSSAAASSSSSTSTTTKTTTASSATNSRKSPRPSASATVTIPHDSDEESSDDDDNDDGVGGGGSGGKGGRGGRRTVLSPSKRSKGADTGTGTNASKNKNSGKNGSKN